MQDSRAPEASVEVRVAGLADAEAIRAIYNVEVTGSTATFDLRPRSAAAQRTWVERHQGAHPVLVAVERGVVTGFGALSPFRERPAYATTVEDSVYVAEPWRGRGVGRLLLNELVDTASRNGFHTIIARVSAENAPSIGLHQAVGFALVGVEREIGRKFGRWLDVAVLQLLLSSPA